MNELNSLQKLRRELVDKYYDLEKAQQAYAFIVGSQDAVPSANLTVQDDGIYIIYKDGTCELFNGENKKEDVANVAFKFGPVSLKLHERDVNDAAMTTTEEGDGHYVNRCSDAVADYDGASNTQSLLSRGLDVSLPDDSFIPSLGQLYVMYAIKNKLNEALEYVGHDPLADAWYWSSTEISATYAWSLAFFSGYFDYYYKTYELRVRPVSAFIPSSL